MPRFRRRRLRTGENVLQYKSGELSKKLLARYRSDGSLIESSFPTYLGGLEFVDRTHVLVTGGGGFIGSELVRQLAAEGFSVTVRNWEPRSVPSHA
jgi:hypothetical protein